MKKLIAALMASTIVAALPAVALAQAATDPAAPGVTMPAPAAPSATPSAGAEGQLSWTDLMAALNVQAAGGGSSLSDMNELVAGISESSNVEIIDVFSLDGAPAPADSASDLQASLEDGSQALTDLHTAISANAVLPMKLEEAGHQVSDVVAVTSGPDGTFMIYVRPAGAAIDQPAPSPAPDAGAAVPSAPAPAAPPAGGAPSGPGY